MKIVSHAHVPGSFVPAIRGYAADGWQAFAERHGADPARSLREAGLQAAPGPADRFPLAAYCALFEASARHTGIETFGLRFGLSRHERALGPLWDRARAAPTLASGLSAIARHLPLLQEQSAITIRRHGPVAVLDYRVRDGRIVVRGQDAELTIGVLLGVMRTALGAQWTPSEVHFEHVHPAKTATHEDLLGAPVHFAAGANAILFPASVLDAAMPRARSDLHAPTPAGGPETETSGREEFLGLICETIRANLHEGELALTRVARAHGMSEATLYRRLRARGVAFGDLVTDVRRQMALHLLAQPHVSLTEIAALLGYAELSVFSRAFRRWTGVSPAAYRRALH